MFRKIYCVFNLDTENDYGQIKYLSDIFALLNHKDGVHQGNE